ESNDQGGEIYGKERASSRIETIVGFNDSFHLFTEEGILRNLIPYASGAIDKIYSKQLNDDSLVFTREADYIKRESGKESKTLTVADTGIGMTKEELESNLGTIARSGSLDFKSQTEMEDDFDIIGQFGVGFYAAFMVADTVNVVSKAFGEDVAYEWQSN